MKRLTLLFAAMIASATIFSQTNWFPQESGTNKVLFGVSFINQDEGWLCGNTGLIMHTEDGGANWVQQDAPPNNTYYSIYFTDALNGWASGYSGKLIHTTDGGETWYDQVSGTTDYLYDFYFLNADTGWAVGGDYGGFPSYISHRLIKYTQNGGNTWTTQLGETYSSPLKSVSFTDFNNGYAVGESGIVLHTGNGGASWETLMEDQSYHFYGVSTVNSNTAYVVGEYLGLPHVPVIFTTTDMGATWTSQTFEEGMSFGDIFFTDEYNGWIAGGSSNGGLILSTNDGGQNWYADNTGTDNFLYTIDFTDPETGWAVGLNGTIISTVLRTGLEDVVRTESLQVYPNPATSVVNISLDAEQSSSVTVSLVNSIGQVVYSKEELIAPGQSIFSIETSKLQSGYYFAILENGKDRISRKVVVRN